MDSNNKLAPYLERIHEISQLPHCDRKNRGNTSNLQGFCEAWKEEACSPSHAFSKLQRDWVHKNYMIPSARYAAQSGVYSPLGQAIFYGNEKKNSNYLVLIIIRYHYSTRISIC